MKINLQGLFGLPDVTNPSQKTLHLFYFLNKLTLSYKQEHLVVGAVKGALSNKTSYMFTVHGELPYFLYTELFKSQQGDCCTVLK